MLNDTNVVQTSTCFLCGSTRLLKIDYLNLSSQSIARNIAYALPQFLAQFLSSQSQRFASMYHPVVVNKKYFSRGAVYCLDCHTGSCQPFFEEGELAHYYKEFYWNNRDTADGQHVSQGTRPNSRQLELARQRIEWIRGHLELSGSAIDFGAGDCAASYVLMKEEGLAKVHVADPSMRAELLSRAYGLSYSPDMSGAPLVDFIYAAHSIEHVHDIHSVMARLLEKIQVGGHIFFETPNIGDSEIFSKLVHTPHTFMFSEMTFRWFESQFPLRIVALDTCGPMWRQYRHHIHSNERTDLRTLLKKTAETTAPAGQ